MEKKEASVEVVRAEHPDWGYRKLAAACGVSERKARECIAGNVNSAPRERRNIRGIPVGEFVKSIDYAAQVREGIRKILGDVLMRESDFRLELRIPSDKFRRAADLPEFDDNKVTHRGGVIFWGSAANVKKIKQKQEEYR